MRKLTMLLATSIMLIACKENAKTNEMSKDESVAVAKVYPEAISKIFKAHGGIDAWNTMESLEFGMDKKGAMEMTTVALRSRKSLIETPDHKLGFDGTNIWLQQKDTVTYKGNAKFYYNLMFYFYAMPFVLADDGITYKDIEALEVDGKKYPGIHISYASGIGESPDDEYILYYDSETNKMAWLAYTVTFFSKEKAKKYNLIKYATWQDLNGLQLPATLQWYKYKDGKVGEMANEMKFINTNISKEIDATLFSKPEDAKVM